MLVTIVATKNKGTPYAFTLNKIIGAYILLLSQYTNGIIYKHEESEKFGFERGIYYGLVQKYYS